MTLALRGRNSPSPTGRVPTSLVLLLGLGAQAGVGRAHWPVSWLPWLPCGGNWDNRKK